ncbi:hypothetical protein VPH35_066077 [Triticum aestivum]
MEVTTGLRVPAVPLLRCLHSHTVPAVPLLRRRASAVRVGDCSAQPWRPWSPPAAASPASLMPSSQPDERRLLLLLPVFLPVFPLSPLSLFSFSLSTGARAMASLSATAPKLLCPRCRLPGSGASRPDPPVCVFPALPEPQVPSSTSCSSPCACATRQVPCFTHCRLLRFGQAECSPSATASSLSCSFASPQARR